MTRSGLAALIGAALFCWAPGAHGQMALLDDDGLKRAYSGKTHLSFYRYPIEEYGGLYFEESYAADGALFYVAGDVRAEGRWRVENGRVCFDYPDTPLLPGCFAVAYEDGCFYSYQIDDDGKPLGLARGQWWIRAHIKGTKPDCAAGDLVS